MDSAFLAVPEYVAVGGHRLAVRRLGQGPAVLLLHGIPTWSWLWREVAPALAERAEVVAVDLLGYGESDKPPDVEPTLPRQAELVQGLLDQLGLRDVVVVGHDIGGGVAQLLALRPGAPVRALVLVDSIAYDSFPEPGIARLKEPAWDEIILRIDLAKGFQKGLQSGVHHAERATPELAARYAAPFAGEEGRRAYLRAARALHTADLAERMPEVERLTLPTLLVWGRHDSFQPLRYGEQLAGRLASARLVVIETAGHFLPEDEPEQLARLIAELL